MILFHTIEDPFINAGGRLANGLVKAPVPLHAEISEGVAA